LYQFISTERHKLLISLAKNNENIFSIKIGPKHLVFLYDIETITEAFVTKGDIVSDRLGRTESDRTMLMKKIGKGKHLIFQSMRASGLGDEMLEETGMKQSSKWMSL
jgi:hypothetical protein